jgi:catechol 2,3-dioxygenase
LRAADILLESGVYIETGPHVHAIQHTFFLDVYETGGNRVANVGAHLGLEADRVNRGGAQEGPSVGPEDDQWFHTEASPVADEIAGAEWSCIHAYRLTAV